MELRYTIHARQQMRRRRFTEENVVQVLEYPGETFIGESVDGRYVYHKRLGRRSLYVLLERGSDPPRVITVMNWRPLMAENA